MKNLKRKTSGLNTIGTDTMRKKMGEVLDSVYFRGDEYIIERKHKPLAVLVSVEKYDRINKSARDTLAREFLVKTLRKCKNPTISEQEAEDLAIEAQNAVRKSQ